MGKINVQHFKFYNLGKESLEIARNTGKQTPKFLLTNVPSNAYYFLSPEDGYNWKNSSLRALVPLFNFLA